MELKFSFGGASPDHHDHGDAPSGIPLPFTTVPTGSASSVLEIYAHLVTVSADEATSSVAAEARSGDGVIYASANVPVHGTDPEAIARALRSAVSRAVAGLEGPLAEAVTAFIVNLSGTEHDVLGALGMPVDPSNIGSTVTNDDFQRRAGLAAGTPIRFRS